jgi:hypothetical protein
MTASQNDRDVTSEIVSIAMAKVANRDGWLAHEVEADPVQKRGDNWVVWIWRLPRMPGGDRTVVISSDKKVVGYYYGR